MFRHGAPGKTTNQADGGRLAALVVRRGAGGLPRICSRQYVGVHGGPDGHVVATTLRAGARWLNFAGIGRGTEKVAGRNPWTSRVPWVELEGAVPRVGIPGACRDRESTAAEQGPVALAGFAGSNRRRLATWRTRRVTAYWADAAHRTLPIFLRSGRAHGDSKTVSRVLTRASGRTDLSPGRGAAGSTSANRVDRTPDRPALRKRNGELFHLRSERRIRARFPKKQRGRKDRNSWLYCVQPADGSS